MNNLLVGLTILLFALKLMGHIDWSWWWVFSPMVIYFSPLIIALLVILVISIIESLIWLFSTPEQRKVQKAIRAVEKLESRIRASQDV